MLSFIRTTFGKWFLITIVGLISLVFVIWGVFPESKYGGTGRSTEVASVGGQIITLQELNQAYKRNMEMYSQMAGELPEQLLQSLKQQTLQGLVQQKLMVIEADRLGIGASDSEVMEEIVKIPVFQNKQTKKFDRANYQAILANNGLSPSQFEDSVRASLSQQRLVQFLEGRIRITDEELRREYRLNSDQRDLEFVRFNRTDALKKVSVPAKEVDQFLADPSKQAVIQNFYTQNSHLYNREETVCARHILVRFGKDDKAKATPPKVFTALKPTPANFAKLAEKYSEDPGTKTQGGDLGCFARKVMDPAFSDVAFSTPINQVSKPVKTAFGWHYILKYKVNPAMNRTLEQAKRDVAEEILKREKSDKIHEVLMDEAARVAKHWPPADPKPTTTGLFSRLDPSVPKIGRADEILKAAFDPKAPIQTSPQIFEAQGGVIVAKVKVAKKPNMDEFQKSRKAQEDSLKQRKLRTFLPAWMEDVRSRTKVSFNENALKSF
jgi:peptidyl-prolyl cis-trans isomerase D